MTQLDKSLNLAMAPGHRLQWEEAQNAHVVLYPEGMVELNQTSAEILKLCDGRHQFASLVSTLEAQFSVSGIADDVEEFIEVALSNGWIKQS